MEDLEFYTFSDTQEWMFPVTNSHQRNTKMYFRMKKTETRKV